MITREQGAHLLTMVVQMRAAQKQYIETRDKYDLFRAKDWERDVDRYLMDLRQAEHNSYQSNIIEDEVL